MTDLGFPATVIDWSPEAIVALICLLILTDRLIARRRLEEEQARTKKAQEQTDKALDLITEVGAQVEKLTDAVDEIASDNDMSVALLQGLRKRLGIEEDQ